MVVEQDSELSGPGELGELSQLPAVTLPVFEGPLDLLLHLIRKHEIDIFDIPIAKILDEYLAYLKWMQTLNLDVAGEFLVMAATLAQIKSRLLLPGDQREEEQEAEEEDPRAELVRRLLEYQRYQEAAEQLRQRPVMLRDVFTRERTSPSVTVAEDSPFAEVSVFKLIEALDRVMRKVSRSAAHEVIVERISLASRIQQLAELLSAKSEVTFEELFTETPTRALVVVTFFALLEMTRLSLIRLHQAEDSETIYVRPRSGTLDVANALQALEPDKSPGGEADEVVEPPAGE